MCENWGVVEKTTFLIIASTTNSLFYMLDTNRFHFMALTTLRKPPSQLVTPQIFHFLIADKFPTSPSILVESVECFWWLKL